MTDQERERVAKELEALQDCHDGGARFEFCLGCLAEYVLKEVEKAEARGMKKAAEALLNKKIALFGCSYIVATTGRFLSECKLEERRDYIKAFDVEKIITEANKTFVAEGEIK